ncbi:hypothetical protein A3K64_04385 [Candidatus Micrarchaeota archaeon RBG_16_36_9]|nr:MAG: hypothetical protein A3K64_04385 [Candidatus Micrarchaeota archaeon RBG_16_36_9]
MNRPMIVFLNLLLIIIGFFIIYSTPWNALAIILGMFLISASIISFAVLIYFPPAQPRYVKLNVIESPKIPKKIAKKTRKRSKKRRR